MATSKKIQKVKAKNLLEKTILSQKEIATYLRVSEKTITKWKKDFEKEKESEKEINSNLITEISKISTTLNDIKELLNEISK